MSTELVVPLTSPLKLAKLRVTAFIDRGTVYSKGQRFGDQTLSQARWPASGSPRHFPLKVAVRTETARDAASTSAGNVLF